MIPSMKEVEENSRDFVGRELRNFITLGLLLGVPACGIFCYMTGFFNR